MRVQRGIKDNGNAQALSSTFLEISEKDPKCLADEPAAEPCPYPIAQASSIEGRRSGSHPQTTEAMAGRVAPLQHGNPARQFGGQALKRPLSIRLANWPNQNRNFRASCQVGYIQEWIDQSVIPSLFQPVITPSIAIAHWGDIDRDRASDTAG
ncbi:MAG TPA: hypothetical protein V6D46_10970 [Coleofasciculaceae cyanobacterium]